MQTAQCHCASHRGASRAAEDCHQTQDYGMPTTMHKVCRISREYLRDCCALRVRLAAEEAERTRSKIGIVNRSDPIDCDCDVAALDCSRYSRCSGRFECTHREMVLTEHGCDFADKNVITCSKQQQSHLQLTREHATLMTIGASSDNKIKTICQFAQLPAQVKVES